MNPQPPFVRTAQLGVFAAPGSRPQRRLREAEERGTPVGHLFDEWDEESHDALVQTMQQLAQRYDREVSATFKGRRLRVRTPWSSTPVIGTVRQTHAYWEHDGDREVLDFFLVLDGPALQDNPEVAPHLNKNQMLIVGAPMLRTAELLP